MQSILLFIDLRGLALQYGGTKLLISNKLCFTLAVWAHFEPVTGTRDVSHHTSHLLVAELAISWEEISQQLCFCRQER